MTLTPLATTIKTDGLLREEREMVTPWLDALALQPAPQNLPALSSVVASTEAAFRGSMLQGIRSGEFKTLSRACQTPAKALRAAHPGLWRQL